MKIPFAKVDCSGNELEYLTEVLKSGWLTTAGKAQKFEKLFAKLVGAKYACAVNSCTAALHLGLEALTINPGDKVFVPTMTFTASAEVVRYLNADPIFLDVEYGTSLITPQILQKAIKDYPEVKTLILVHFGGHASEMIKNSGKGILDICHENGIRILEDAAHAFPSSLNGKKIGAFGDITCFSFYANKTITTGEGGMLVTDNDDIFKRVKIMRLHGINRDIWDRFTSDKPSWEYDVVAPGYKYNMPDVNAAIGLAQLERVEEFRLAREKCAQFYYEHLSKIDCVDLPMCKVDFSEHSWHLFPLVIKPNALLGRNEFIEKMAELGVGTSVHYKPIHRMTYYKNRYKLNPENYPNAEKIWNGTVSLPIYNTLSFDELKYVCECVKKCLRAG